jgi:hypothetical protein
MRGFTREAALRMELRSPGMEFASEMVIKGTLLGLRMAEVPTVLSPDGRDRRPHLRTWRDGWRHLRFMLLFSPTWLFVYPGLVLTAAGAAALALIARGPLPVLGVTLDVDTMLFAAAATAIGFQSCLLGVFARVFAVTQGLLPSRSLLVRAAGVATLEWGILCGGALFLVGVAGSVHAVRYWAAHGFGDLDARAAMRMTIPAVTAMIVGLQAVLGSFFLSLLGLRGGKAGGGEADRA